MRFRILLVSFLLTIAAWAGIVDDVRLALAQNKFSSAESELDSYRNQQGVNAEYLEAYSWLGRAALEQRQYDRAAAYAKETKTLAAEQLKKRPLDADPHLPIALGAALEVEAQVLAARGERTQAVALLQSALRTYGNTSIQARLRKNLNLLSLQGKSAPLLRSEQNLGGKLTAPAQLKGSPVLLFFWAHWCADCKAEAPIITQLRSEFAGKGLQVIGPTRYYGYTAQSEHASAADELKYIDSVRQRFYGGLLDMPVPISKYNFDTYGASTTPTLVLLDRAGKVAMYHPGALPYDQLRAEIEKVVRQAGQRATCLMQMTYIPDLSKYTYADSAYYRPVTKAVGWLSGAHDFEIASPLDASLDLLWKYCKVSVAQMRGFHDCELCPSPYLAARDKPSLLLALKQADSVRLAKRNGEELLLGSAEIRVFGNGDLIYAAPNLIYHYVSVHRYSPPEEFLKALHESPTPPAPEYFKRLSKLNLG